MTSDKCYRCGVYIPEGRQICSACEKEATTQIHQKTPNGIVNKWMPEIVNAAKSKTGRTVDMKAVYEIGRIGLAAKLANVADDATENIGYRYELIKAMADTRILLEMLHVVHCSNPQYADAYRFYLEQAAKAVNHKTKTEV